MSKVWLTKRDIFTKYLGYPSLSNGYDGLRKIFLDDAYQDHRISETKRECYQVENLELVKLLLDDLILYENFKPLKHDPIKIILPLKKETKEDLIYLSGKFVFVRSDFAEILMRFNLGETKLFNVGRPLGRNGKTIYDHEFYLLNVTEWRNFFVSEKSELVRSLDLFNEGYKVYSLGDSGFRKSKVALSKQSLECDVDIWHDPMVRDSIFFSDRLKTALDEKGLLAQTKHKKCLVLT